MSSSVNYQDYLTAMEAVDHECSLCYEDFTDQHPPVVLDCRHVFGKECLEKWAESANAQRKNCPNCRAPLLEEDAPAAPPAQPTRPVQPVQPVQPIQPTLRVVNNALPATPISDPILYDIDYHTRAIHHTFESSLYHPSSFNRKLWRRLDTAAHIVLVDVLRKFDYYTTALVVPEMDYKHQLQRSLGGDQVATFLTRRIMQWVMTMVMLSPMVPMEMDVIQGCFELLPDLHHEALDFDVVNAAAVEPTVENASILKVMAMLLVDHSVEHVCTELGAQWYVDADPSAEFYVAATLVRERLGRASRSKKEQYRQLKVSSEDVVKMWAGGEEEGTGVFQGMLDGFRGLFRRDDAGGLREARRVLTRNTQPRSRDSGGEAPRQPSCADYQRQGQHGRGRSRNFTFFSYSSERY